MPETSTESAVELRFKQINRYMTIGLLSILVLGVIFSLYLANAKQNETIANQNQQLQAQAAIDSDICQVYPSQSLCVIAREIAQDPTNPVTDRETPDGKDGKDGTPGRGVSSFTTNASGDLIVTYTDGRTQNAGRVLGPKGDEGAPGKDGRGIISSEVIDGSLIIRYSDGTSQNMGVVVGPAGTNGIDGTPGANGADGKEGPPGKDGKDGINGTNGLDGVSVSRVYTRASDNMVIVELSNGVSNEVGTIISTTIQSVTCTAGTLTVTMTDGRSASAGVRCSDDPGTYTPAPPSVPEPEIPPTTVPQTQPQL